MRAKIWTERERGLDVTRGGARAVEQAKAEAARWWIMGAQGTQAALRSGAGGHSHEAASSARMIAGALERPTRRA